VIRGLHHITATVGEAQPDLDCYVRALGLRLVKKTVNFDNHNVYHFYYGNEVGKPGTLMTTFPYAGQGVPKGVHGAGQITATAFSVPANSIEFWRNRLTDLGFELRDEVECFGDTLLSFTDPSGLVIELAGCEDDERIPWLTDDIASDSAIRGLCAPSLCIRNPETSIRFLTDVLGWQVEAVEGSRTRLSIDGDKPGNRIDIVHAPDAPQAVNGLGTVHHVAMGVDDEGAQQIVRENLLSRGVDVTPVRDRQYFQSIYFREPGGVLFEVATIPPGFLIDESLSSLGQGLKLPSWEEANRVSIEAGLEAVKY